jgi:37-kD nucleoid-associated bacterial protein
VNYARFNASEVIIHEVPQRFVGGPAQQLTLSDRPEPLSGQLRTFFEGKLRGSLARHGFDVEHDPQSPSAVPGLVAGVIAHPGQLVAASQQMAEQLHHVQTGVNPAGLLCVALGSTEGAPSVAVLKVERENGVQVRPQQQGGGRSLTMYFLDDLMITGKTRIFKASAFEGDTVQRLDGRVADDQRGLEHSNEVASFFLSSFLGCRLKTMPSIATKEFFLVTEQFIDEHVDDPERKADYTVALLAMMKAPARDIRPRDFAELHFEPTDRTPYRAFMAERNVEVDQVFEKDTALVSNRIRKVRLETRHGLMVLGPENEIRERVQVGPEQVVINDRVTKTQGR